ncbi:hypothetical protein N7519_003100 [Penicillium mononematosum]|uniref:uncharacterized protein n=1 Tax=Penicillium mononematosum TaxID=268346 RepID=UPI002548089B|nr:uncharacterized protein N7519_003100 [Penicillium mononematosum]KAJ6188192.1 hypothetical protein N7519_003100 [Penicillium mononematosum]
MKKVVLIKFKGIKNQHMPCWWPTRANVITNDRFALISVPVRLRGWEVRLALEQKMQHVLRDIVTLQHKFEIEHKYTISTRRFAP